MKKEEKQRLQEEDRFIRFMSRFWDGVKARAKRVSMVLALLLVALLVVAIAAAVREYRSDATASAIDKAETLAEMEASLASYPRAADLLIRLGNAYMARNGKGDVESAVSMFERATDCSSEPLERGVARLSLGKAEMEQGRYEEALKCFDAVAADRDVQPMLGDEANWRAGRCLEQMGNTEEAQARYARILSFASEAGSRAELWKALAKYRMTKLQQEALD